MFKFEDGKCYRMPAHFGGAVFNPDAKAYYHDMVTLVYSYTTDGVGSPTICRKASS